MTYSTNEQDKGRNKGKDSKSSDSKPKEIHNYFEGDSGSKRKKKFENTKYPYCMRGFHLENQCMKKHIDQLWSILKQNHISLPQRVNKYDVGQPTEDHERFHAMKDGLTRSKYYLIDYGASNHMVSSRISFTTLSLIRGPKIHMGDDSQIPATGRGSVKIQHDEFKNALYVPSPIAKKILQDEEEA